MEGTDITASGAVSDARLPWNPIVQLLDKFEGHWLGGIPLALVAIYWCFHSQLMLNPPTPQGLPPFVTLLLNTVNYLCLFPNVLLPGGVAHWFCADCFIYLATVKEKANTAEAV